MKSKESIRLENKKKRDSMDSLIKEKLDRKIYENLIKSKAYANSNFIFIYVSMKNEVDTHRIIKFSIENGKKVCVPKVISKKDGMESVLIKSFSDLKAGKYGILEPKEDRFIVNPKDVDLVITPGLAFDMSGGRLGYGAGFYDRFLKDTSKDCIKAGIAYSFQLEKEIPTGSEDIPVDIIVTENEIITI